MDAYAPEVARPADARLTLPFSPIPSALDNARDRLDRTDAALTDLSNALTMLATRLGPVLTDGAPDGPPEPAPMTVADPSEDVDRRSTICRSILDLARLADAQGDYVVDLIRRVSALTEAVEA